MGGMKANRGVLAGIRVTISPASRLAVLTMLADYGADV